MQRVQSELQVFGGVTAQRVYHGTERFPRKILQLEFPSQAPAEEVCMLGQGDPNPQSLGGVCSQTQWEAEGQNSKPRIMVSLAEMETIRKLVRKREVLSLR